VKLDFPATKYNDNGLKTMAYRQYLLLVLLFSMLGNFFVPPSQIAIAEAVVDCEGEECIQPYSVVLSPKSVVLGANTVISGHVVPATANTSIDLSYLAPNEVVIVRNISSMFEGEFHDEFMPSIAGRWQVQATWRYNATHAATSEVKYFKVYEGESDIICSISAMSLTKGGMLTITGVIDPQLPDMPVTVKYRRDGEWNHLATMDTTVNGSFSCFWWPLEEGEYRLKAYWSGDNTFSGACSEMLPVIVTSVASNTTQSDPISETDNPVLSVQSNSTIDQLIFDSERKVLSISVSGENGTTGYVQVVLSKALVPDLSKLHVYLDDESVFYNTKSTVDSWILTVEYRHSTHTLKVSLSAHPLGGSVNQLVVICVGFVSAAIFAFLFLTRKPVTLTY
jgi:hypothetical protein